ncbi:MAG: FAD-dependent oxidoreductase [Chloroflexota bacterium]
MGSYDVVVIGGGMAGLTAGLFSARLGRSTLVLEPQVPGGHLLNIEKIEDFPGFPQGVPGFEIGPGLQEQAANFGAEFSMETAESIERNGDGWRVVTNGDQHDARAVIVAAGSVPRELGVPGEHDFEGKGISHCASCDGPLMRGATVAVAGGGDSGLQEALTLANFASKVIVIERGDALSGSEVYRQRATASSAVEVRLNSTVASIIGEKGVSAVQVLDGKSNQSEEIAITGLFIYAGLRPNTDFIKGTVELDGDGKIKTDLWMRTDQPGVLAAGDIRADSASQAITSAGDGATAAIAAHRFLESGTWRTT